MKNIFLVLLSILIFSCSSPKDPFVNKDVSNKENKTENKENANTSDENISRVINLSLINGNINKTKVIGEKVDGSRAIHFRWSNTDVINIAYSQNGVSYKVDPLLLERIEGNIAMVKLIVPKEIKMDKPFDIYGFVGRMASWVDPISAIPSLRITTNKDAVTDIRKATEDMPMCFSVKNVNSKEPVKAQLKHIGMIVAVSVTNNSKNELHETLNMEKVVLFMKSKGQSTLPKSVNGEYLFSFDDTKNNSTERNESLQFNLDKNDNILKGEDRTFYSWVYYPENYNVDNVDISFDTYANGKKMSLRGEHKIKKQNTALAFNYCASYYDGNMYAIKATPREIKGNNWLKYIDDNRPFYTLLLTGTHDAATYNNGWASGAGLVKCQSKNFSEQFNSGVRALDLRPRWAKTEDIEISHGPISTGIYMSTAFNDAIKFLGENPSEFIVFLIKDENSKGGKDLNDAMKKLVDRYSQFIYQGDITNNTKLSDIRGKIILLFRDELLADTNGKIYIGGWPDNTTYYPYAYLSKIYGKLNGRWNYTGLMNVILQDNYNKPDKDEKIRLYKESVQKSYDKKAPNGQTVDFWCVSYLSANGGGEAILWGWKPYQYADYINPRIKAFYEHEADVNYNGITFMDFAADPEHKGLDLVRQMYLNNFKK